MEGNLASGRIEAFVADGDTGFRGFAVTFAVPASLRLGRFWQIRDLFVAPEHRRAGVGRALLVSVRVAATAAGASRIVLQTETGNTAALRLYASCGYAAVEGYCSLTLPLPPG